MEIRPEFLRFEIIMGRGDMIEAYKIPSVRKVGMNYLPKKKKGEE